MPRRMMVFIDGENLVMRYQAMLEKGFTPTLDVVHVRDTFVWHPKALRVLFFDIVRTTYYTYVVGTDEYLKEISDEIKKFTYTCKPDPSAVQDTNHLYPKIFKKNKQSAKRKGVDISIAVDALILGEAFNLFNKVNVTSVNDTLYSLDSSDPNNLLLIAKPDFGLPGSTVI